MFDAIEKLISERRAAYKAGKLTDAQAIESELALFNVALTDTAEGTSWEVGL